jgi:hypothetical protein
MKLNFVIEKHSTTDIQILKTRTVTILRKYKYDEISESSNTIVFKELLLGIFGRRMAQAGKVNKGTFEFYNLNEDENVIRCSYSISLLFPLIAVIMFIILFVAHPVRLTIGDEIKAFLFFVSVLVIIFLIQLLMTRSQTLTMLQEITNEPTI